MRCSSESPAGIRKGNAAPSPDQSTWSASRYSSALPIQRAVSADDRSTLYPEFLSRSLDHLCDLENRELLSELIEHPALARLRGIQAGQFDAANCVAYVQVS